jgi:hypothetical protein
MVITRLPLTTAATDAPSSAFFDRSNARSSDWPEAVAAIKEVSVAASKTCFSELFIVFPQSRAGKSYIGLKAIAAFVTKNLI